MQHLLTILILLPIAGALASVIYSFAPGRREEHYKWIGLLTTVATFVVSLLLLRGIGGGGGGVRFEENGGWISLICPAYYLGVDGISFLLGFVNSLFISV